MSDLNKVMLIGRLGKDPECKAMPSGEHVANFSLATGDKWKDKETGEPREKTEWHRITAFGTVVVKVIEPYCKKGNQVYIEGALRTRKWQDKQGNERFTTEIVLQQIQLLGNAGGSSRDGPPSGDPPRTGGSPPRQRQAPAGGSPTAGSAAEDFDDDIPF
jgi:single-strand DNA-binding protein